ncbi:MAG: hypothetical protein UR39_C0001G0022 [Candidatus Woesebacteria bacterium GW2011_GWA1_33_30]|uniref:Uncharacterized protein n=1 Tax=Candidatus Woesebacteria bacterium GW2011_GWA2_33_28 TaxID=1618561 RepID=A0A0G0CXX8_9BACT|nr:MAG: hypothetical protein UR38_C0001G0023 [Candidatus Woesebacteria bacterium GW2011_GWA2_33_28]KKP48989.1 MAG: hypothetical protein UR39_C0001G0022 [Candidatus Woesebacteria bacterium GW2011_GWA1_33_30]KKP49903.1 MAG: hypothetical protein UR40_C0003G0075 [Microgenomates group bacterium GW2011_GWC1_33_32]KKP52581.1 MAG: hypothetical protein UR44_C0001G0023 [Candidatus Woesebacteria bacterium GW2011_GWB1_33_38]
MVINKFSKDDDRIANLYRAAYYIATGVEKIGLDLIDKTQIPFPKMNLSTEKERKYWAEKVLDKYMFLKMMYN